MKDKPTKKFTIGVSVGYLKVKNTAIEIAAENEEEAEDLAVEYARDNHDICDWKDCQVVDLNYQVENL